MAISTQALCSAVNELNTAYLHCTGQNDRLFVERIYKEGLDKYRLRLKSIGFTGHQNVLDAGCGYGQWSLALAELNQTVRSFDFSQLRVDFLVDLARKLKVSNLDVQAGTLDSLPYQDNSFDIVFCYGVIFLTPWRKSLVELTRVLKPGGRLYVNANGLGWYMFLWQEEHNKADDYDPKSFAAQTLVDTLSYDRNGVYAPGMSLIIEPSAIESALRELGFCDIKTAGEGCLHLDIAEPAPKPFFKGEYMGQTGVYEVTGKRR